MKGMYLAICFAVFATLLFAGQMTITEFEQQIWQLTNTERAKFDLPPLCYDPGLAALARIHSQNMLRYSFFAHKDQLGDMVDDRKKKYYPQLIVASIGENLARFYNSEKYFSPQEIVEGWMNSPDHRENILHEDYTYLGVGVVLKGTVLIATQNFATPLVKILSPLPQKLCRDKGYRVELEYMSSNPPQELCAALYTPDPGYKHRIDATRFSLGTIPQKLCWTDARHLYIDTAFPAGKGSYTLMFGFNNAYFEEGIILKVK